MKEEELIEELKKLLDSLRSEIDEHNKFQEVSKMEILKAYHAGQSIARRAMIDRILKITGKYYRDRLEESIKHRSDD